jgi:HD superfamily phosphohydrolase
MRGGLYAAEALIAARYWMHKQVYFHKTRLACNRHLELAMKAILAEQQEFDKENAHYPSPDSKKELDRFMEWDDYRVMGLIAAGQGGEHGKRLIERDHYRLVCELEESDARLDELEASTRRNEAILESLKPMLKFVDQPRSEWYKMKSAGDEIILVEDDGDSVIGPLSRHSALMRSINIGYLSFVYVDKPDAEAARKLYRDFLEKEKAVAKSEATAEATASPGGPSNDVVAADGLIAPAAQIERDSRSLGDPIDGRSAELKLEPPSSPVKSVRREEAPKKGAQDAV